MFLVDTNLCLEMLLDQEKAGEARKFIQGVEAENLAIMEFSLYSLGILPTRLTKDELFEDFLSDTLEDSGVTCLRLDILDLRALINYRRRFRLDFDDAYQCVAADKYGCTLVSCDSDFDNTPQGRKTPRDAMP